MSKTHKYTNRRGSGMIFGLFAVLIIFTLGALFLSVSSASLYTSNRDVLRTRALACAEAGVDMACHYLMEGGPNGEDAGVWRTEHPSSDPTNHAADALYTARVDPDNPNETYNLCVNDGKGITQGMIVVTSTGTVTDRETTVSRTIKVILKFNKDNVNVWNNVIFGGVGQAGRSVNGNVAIRGSVHLLGDGETYTDIDSDGHWDDNETYTDSNHNGQYDLGEPYTDTDRDGHRDAREPFQDVNGNGTRDPALTVTDMASEISGTANIGNNYSGMSADLNSKIPAVSAQLFGGESVQTLEAKLRVKHGKVNVSGAATVGDTNITGNSTKETLDGAYVSDGFGGNAGTGSVHSDNGYTNGYDLGDGLVNLPVIDDGAYTIDGVTYTNYLAYLRATSTVITGDLNITKGVPFTVSSAKGSISMDAAGVLSITGKVYVTGNISMGPSKSRILYSGKGTLTTPNSCFIHCDILPKVQFPTTDTLGLIAGDRVELATGSGDAQLTMALAMYAQHKVVSTKQSEIAGTLVSSYYEMSNVPRIYQVPDLANNLPPGMPGADPIWIASIDIQSWQEQF